MNRNIVRFLWCACLVAIAPMAMAQTNVSAPDLQSAIDAATDGDTLHLEDADDYDPIVLFGDKNLNFTGVDGATIRNDVTTGTPAVRIQSSSATAAVAYDFSNVDIKTSASLNEGLTTMNIVHASTPTFTMDVSFTSCTIENQAVSGSSGGGRAIVVNSHWNTSPTQPALLTLNFDQSDLLTQTEGQGVIQFREDIDGNTTVTQIAMTATDTTIANQHTDGGGSIVNVQGNRPMLNVDFDFEGVALSTAAGEGFLLDAPSMRECDYSFVDCSFSNDGNFQDLVRIQADDEGGVLQGSNTVLVDSSVFHGNGSDGGQNRLLRVNISGDDGMPLVPTTVTNSLFLVDGGTDVQTLPDNETFDGETFINSQNHSIGIGTERKVELWSHHNTFVGGPPRGFAAIWAHSFHDDGSGIDNATHVKNCVIWNFAGRKNVDDGSEPFFGAIYNQDQAVIDASGNVVAGEMTDPWIAPLEDDIVTTPFLFATGDSPNMSDLPSNDWSLFPHTSPALGNNEAQTTDLGLATDIEGSVRPQPATPAQPDAGAYEDATVPVEMGSFSIE